MKDEKGKENSGTLLSKEEKKEEMPAVSSLSCGEEENGGTEEEDQKKKEPKAEKRKAYREAWKKVLSETAFLLFLLLLIAVTFEAGLNEEEPDPYGTQTEFMTENAQTEEEIKDSTEDSTEEEELLILTEEEISEDWKDTVFGTGSASVLSNISVTGLSSRDRERTGFRETDFLTALSAFLTEHQISGVTSVDFKEQIACSAADASAYTAALNGESGRALTVIFYEDYPGCYLLTLTENEEEDLEPVPEEEPQETAPAVSPAPDSTPETESENQDYAYDASGLSVVGIPETLLNYIRNRYELQYTLYDYLYRNGYETDSAAVTGYEIDAEKREALIFLTLSDGSGITCTYSRDANTYSYR